MKSTVATTLLLFLCAVVPGMAQYDVDHPEDSVYASPGRFGIGLRGGAVHYTGDVKDNAEFQGAVTPFRLGGDLVLHFRLWQAVQGSNAMRIGLELSGGYRLLSASHSSYDFRTDVFPLSASLTVEFYSMAAIRPFVSFGAGALPYNLRLIRSTLDGERAKEVVGSEKSVAAWFPLRIGLRFTLAPALDLLTTVERSVTLSDRIDGITSDKLDWMNDNFEFYSIGFVWYFLSSSNKDPYGESIYQPAPPALVYDANADNDGDGLKDREESDIYKTNPFLSDSDGDGLQDGEELFTTKTDPLRADTDSDGIPDGRELRSGSNPMDKDSDDDGIEDAADACPDKAETINGFKDTDGCPDEIERGELLFRKLGDIMILENVEFETGRAILLQESHTILDKVARNLNDNPKVEIEVRGHTDSTGDYQRNIALSLQRAESVKAYLVLRGVPAQRIQTVGFGPDQPIMGNETPEGRQRNRRIEFRITRFDE